MHPTSEPRLLDADEVRHFEEPFGTLMLELPPREPGFVLPTWKELTAVVEAARERDAGVHFDGTRLWERPRTWGVLLSPAVPGGVERALLGLERELPRLPEYVAHAEVVGKALGAAGVPWFRVNPEVPHTHRFQVWLSYDADVLADVAVRLAEETRVTLFHRWFPAPKRPPGLSVTEVAVAAEGLEWTERISTPVAFTWCSSLPTPPGINSCRVAEQPESHLCPERRRTLHWPTCCVHGFSRESGG